MAVGHSADMQTLLTRSGEDADAALAVEMFGYGVRKAIGAYAAALGGLDMLVFTGGIGEHAPLVRALACQGLDPLGIALDAAANAQNAAAIGTGPCAVRVMRTNENLVMARHALALVREGTGRPV
jgi:acetate kinase